jgi:hypothetical protein
MMNRHIVGIFGAQQIFFLENLLMTNSLALLLGLINMFLVGMHLLGISTLRAKTKI